MGCGNNFKEVDSAAKIVLAWSSTLCGYRIFVSMICTNAGLLIPLVEEHMFSCVVIEKIGLVEYRLELSSGSRIQDVIHVSSLQP